MIIDTTQTATMGMNHHDYCVGGYNCPYCGKWVFQGQFHSCYSVSPTYCYGHVPTWQPNYNPILDEIKGLLEQLIELLSRE